MLRKRGGEVGPSLDKASRRLRSAWLTRWLSDPRAPGKVYPDRPYRMPDLGLAPDEVATLVRHLRALGGRAPDAPPVEAPPTDDAQLARGEALYRQTCTGCHALGAVIPPTRPPSAPDLIRVAERCEYDWVLRTIVTEGLKRDQADDVRAYIWRVSVQAKTW